MMIRHVCLWPILLKKSVFRQLPKLRCGKKKWIITLKGSRSFALTVADRIRRTA